jgi:hypothetical protein
MENLVPIVIAVLTTLISPLVLEWFKDKLKKPKPDPLQEAINHNEQVNHQLELIIEEIKADRIWIAMFHNGGHFYPTGKSIQKFSILHEMTNLETPSVMDIFQNIPVSLFPKPLAALYNKGEFHFTNETHSNLSCFDKNSEMSSTSMFSIEDLEGRFVGVMSLEFKQPKEFTTENYIFIRNKLGIIGGILSNYLIKLK